MSDSQMEKELKNLNDFLNVLCLKIAGIPKTDDTQFNKKFKYYFLLFVHRIKDFYNSYQVPSVSSVAFEPIDIIDKINKLLQESVIYNRRITTKQHYKKRREGDGLPLRDAFDRYNDANSRLEPAKKNVDEALFTVEEAKKAVKKANNEPANVKQTAIRLTNAEATLKLALSTLDEINRIISENKSDALKIQKYDEALADLTLLEKEKVSIDKKISSLEHLLGMNEITEGHDATFLNKELYEGKSVNVQGKVGTKLKINDEIDKATKAEASTYFLYINTIIHNINPDKSVAVKEYINRFFSSEKLGQNGKKEENIKIRKAFLIYLINNIIYYYITLKHTASKCNKKIWFIFDNRYIKFSNIVMVAPSANEQFTDINKDIVSIFNTSDYLFDLTNNIIRYEYKYLNNCDEYNNINIKDDDQYKEAEQKVAEAETNIVSAEQKVAEAENNIVKARQSQQYIDALKSVENANIDVDIAITKVREAEKVVVDAKAELQAFKKAKNTTPDATKKIDIANTELSKAKQNLKEKREYLSNAGNVLNAVEINVKPLKIAQDTLRKAKDALIKAKTSSKYAYEKAKDTYDNAFAKYRSAFDSGSGNDGNIRDTVFEYNKNLFGWLSKYIQLDFKNRISEKKKEYLDNKRKYIDIIERYNDRCGTGKCTPIVTDIKTGIKEYDDALNNLEEVLKTKIDTAIDTIFLFNNSMNANISEIIELDKKKDDIFDKVLYAHKLKGVDGSLESDYSKSKKPSSEQLTYYEIMRSIINGLDVKHYNGSDFINIFKAFEEIKKRIGNVKIESIRECCLDVDFMKEDVFKGENKHNIQGIIYKRALAEITERILKYNSDMNELETDSKIDEYFKKTNAYIKLIDDIKKTERLAKEERNRIIEEQRKTEGAATLLLEKIEGIKANILGEIRDRRIRLNTKLNKISEREGVYENRDTFDFFNPSKDKLIGYFDKLKDSGSRYKYETIEEIEWYIDMSNISSELESRWKQNNTKKKLYISCELEYLRIIEKTINEGGNKYDSEIEDILRKEQEGGIKIDAMYDKDGRTKSIKDMLKILANFLNATKNANTANELAKREYNEQSDTVFIISDNLVQARNKILIADNNLDAINKIVETIRKYYYDRLLDVIIDAYLKEKKLKETEDSKEIREATDNSVEVAINVGNAITEVIDKQEEEEKELRESKIVADDSVGVAIGVGNAISDTIDKQEKEEKELQDIKGVSDDSVVVAINVGKAIASNIDKQEEEEKELEEIKNASDDSVNVAIDVGNAISDTIEKQEKEERELEEIKNASDDSVGVAIKIGNAISDTIDKQEEEEKELEDIKKVSDDSVKVAIDVGNAISDTIEKQEEEEKELEEIKNASDDSVKVAIDVGNAIASNIEKQEEEEKELEEIKNASDNSVEVAIDVAKQIKDPPIPQPLPVIPKDEEDPEPVDEGSEAEDEEDESEAEEEAEIKQPVKVKRRIDEEYVKGNYLYPGLFNEVKEDDLKAIREYHAEQVRNKFRAKPGAIAKMDAEIDKYNYQQSGGSTGGTADDMIKRLNNFENDINNPIEAFEIKFEDRLVFIITTFFLRYISISIIQRGIDSNMVKTFYEGFIYYGVIYILLFWFIVLFINIDNNYTIDYIDVNNLAIYIRSVFYYFYMGTNGISRLVIHSLLILLIIIIPIILNIKNTKARDMLNEDDDDEVKLLSLEERTKLSKALSLFTLFIWILTSIIASKF